MFLLQFSAASLVFPIGDLLFCLSRYALLCFHAPNPSFKPKTSWSSLHTPNSRWRRTKHNIWCKINTFTFLFFIVWFCYDHPKSDDHSMNLNGKVSRLSLDEMQMNFPTRVDHHKNARNFKATWNTNRERENGSPKTVRLCFSAFSWVTPLYFGSFHSVEKSQKKSHFPLFLSQQRRFLRFEM